MWLLFGDHFMCTLKRRKKENSNKRQDHKLYDNVIDKCGWKSESRD